MEDVDQPLSPRIAVIGGGYSGMAAAVRLVERGARPVVFEAARILGGRARRVDYRDTALDNGQHILSGAYRELLRLMDVVGVGANATLRVPLRLEMPPDFSLRAPLLPAPLHAAFALLGAKGLSWSERWAALRLMRALKRADWRLDREQSVSGLLQRHAQPQKLIDCLWRPLTVSALNTPIGTASAQVFANVLRDALGANREASDLLLPRVDLSALFPEPAARWVERNGGEVRLGTRVSGLRPNQGAGINIDWGTDASERFDAAVVAVAPQQLSAFPSIFAPNAAPSLEFEPITTVYFSYDCALSLHSPMQGQTQGLAQWFFDRRALKGRADGPLIVAAVISASGPHQQFDQDALATALHRELTQHLPGLNAPTWVKVITEKFATFACTPGLLRPPSKTALSNVFLAGDFVDNPYPATLEGAVRNGITAADHAVDAALTSSPASVG